MTSYLAALWIILIVFVTVSFLWRKNERVRRMLEDASFMVAVVMLSFLMMAILTGDPISIAGTTPPVNIQMMSSLGGVGFMVWLYYLNPLKRDVHRIDKDLEGFKGEMRGELRGIKGTMASMQRDIHLIKAHLLGKS